MRFFDHRWGFAALAFVTALPALAQGTISLDAVQFVRTSSSWDGSPAADLRGVSTPLTDDHLYEFGWWFRVPGDSQETAFPLPDTQQYLGDHSLHTWNDVGGRGLFSAEEHATIYTLGSGPPHAIVSVTLYVHNLSDVNPLPLEIFALADFDLQPTAANDTARLVEWTPDRILQLNDTGSSFAQYIAIRQPGQTTHHLVRPFGATDVGAVLSDAAVTDFDDSGAPFGPADFTAGWQLTMPLGPNGIDSARISLNVNRSYNCLGYSGVFCDGLERGDTSIWSAVVP